MNTLTTNISQPHAGRRRKGADQRGERAVSTRCASVAGGASATKQNIKQPVVQERGFLMDLTGRTVRVKEGLLYAGSAGTVTEWWGGWGVVVMLYVDGREARVQYLTREVVEVTHVEQTVGEFLGLRFQRICTAYKQSESKHLDMVLHRRRQQLFNEIERHESAVRRSAGIQRGLSIWKGGREA